MNFKVYYDIPNDSKFIRQTVFVEEQGFCDEFDNADKSATHIVGYDESGRAVSTCRIITCGDCGYLIGRIAVIKEFRGQGLGALTVKEAERVISANGGGRIKIHSQLQAKGFYEAIGYTPTGETDVEQGCPHVMLEKYIT